MILSLSWSILLLCSNDVLSEDRVTGDPIEADKSNFLHPVIYYYRQPPGKSTSCSISHPQATPFFKYYTLLVLACTTKFSTSDPLPCLCRILLHVVGYWGILSDFSHYYTMPFLYVIFSSLCACRSRGRNWSWFSTRAWSVPPHSGRLPNWLVRLFIHALYGYLNSMK